MAVREFTDKNGRQWRAWDIKPHEIHPATKAEDWLADCYVTGWIVFETFAGDEKRRLCPWPIRWVNESEAGLRDLLNKAEIVPPQRVREQRVSGEWDAPSVAKKKAADPGELDVTDLQVVRSFKYPGGRLWVVSVVHEDGSPALRFQSGTRYIDLKKWRKDWADQPDDALVDMLRQAAPRRKSGESPPGVPRRRWDDQALPSA